MSPRRVASRPPPRPGADVGVLRSVSPARREAFRRMGVLTVEDLLRLAPRRYEDRRHPTPVARLEAGATALVVARVRASRALRLKGGLTLLEAEVEDESGSLPVRWFQRGYLPRPLPKDQRVALYGAVKRRGRRLEMISPELERLAEPGRAGAEDPTGSGRIVPVHPRTTGLSAPAVRRAVFEALPVAEGIQDPVPPALGRRYRLPSLAEALAALHFPSDLEEAERARRRLAFDELLVHEILLARRRLARRTLPAPPIPVDARLDRRIRRRFPFPLTPGQERAVGDLAADLGRTHPMHRLLQGDVGSGKTAVAAYALLAAVARGFQGAFMAPTEVLARQHARTLETWLEGSRVRLETLLGARRGADRRAALERVASGEAELVVGTHAVISKDVRFGRLGLVVVDEQHKFGVRQRHELVAKASGDLEPHCLVMTATPIPRTLALTVYGDLDLSVIEDRPPGRRPVQTWVVGPRDGARVMRRVREEIAAGRQAFVIYPLVEESDRVGLRDAQAGRDRWAAALPGVGVGLLHGRLGREEKEAAVEAFRRRETRVLVATVVVEVGVDVPGASVLVVEHAERFGLSQLHQLRGRVGRGTTGGLCVLVDRSPGETPARLEVLAATDDGFRIAEEDLRIRGVGDVLGTRQHGAPGFRAARLPRDLPLLADARRAAEEILEKDPSLATADHARLAAHVRAAGEGEARRPRIGGGGRGG